MSSQRIERRFYKTLVPAFLAVLLSAGAAQAAGFNLISLDQEWSMRGDLHAQVQQQFRLVNDRASNAFINELGRRIAAQTPLGNRPWDFFIIDDPSVNAFNLPGGLVYINRGLIEEADTVDQLANAMAHEIGHGVARHGTQLMSRSYGYSLLAGLLLGRNPSQGQQILAQLVGTGMLTRYSRSAELEADRLGVDFAYRAGYNPRGMVDLFQQLLQTRQRRPTRVEQFFSDHPLTEDRIARAQAEAARYPNRGVHDTRDFQQFRSRLS